VRLYSLSLSLTHTYTLTLYLFTRIVKCMVVSSWTLLHCIKCTDVQLTNLEIFGLISILLKSFIHLQFSKQIHLDIQYITV